MGVPFEKQMRTSRSHMELTNGSHSSDYTIAIPGILHFVSSSLNDQLRYATHFKLLALNRSFSIVQYLPILLSQASPIYPLRTTTIPCSHPVPEMNWIDQDETFQKWLARNNTSILHVHGTSAVSLASEYLCQHLRLSIDLVLYFEFKKHDARYNTIQSMLSTFLAQIISQYENLGDAVIHTFERLSHFHCWTDKDLYEFWVDLRLTRLIDRITYVINGLDQCDESRNWFLAKFLSVAKYSEARCKIVITSMGSQDLQDLLSEFPNINLDDHSNNDIPEILLSSSDLDLMQLFQNHPEYCAFESSLVELLSECGTDIMLRHLIIDWLRFNNHAITKSAIKRRLEKLSPVSLMNVVKTITESIPPERQRWARKVIAWISCSFRPLTTCELQVALALDNDPGRTDFDDMVFPDVVAQLRECFGSVFTIEHNEIHFGHPFFGTFTGLQMFHYTALGIDMMIWERRM